MGSFQYGALVEQLATTATSAGTTTLVNTSKQNQIFTGTTTQTIILPSATTMAVGQSFNIYNQSTGYLSLQFNGGAGFTDAASVNYGTINPKTSLSIVLQTNSTSAGTWAVTSAQTNGLFNSGFVTAKAYSSSLGTTSASTPIIFGTTAYDTASGYSTSTGRYTVSVPGYYRITSNVIGSSTGVTINLYQNGTLSADKDECFVGASGSFNLTFETYCNTGDVIDIRPSSSYIGSNGSIYFDLISGVGQLGAPGPTVQKFLSGTGTYTTPTNVAFITVEMVGGGGGGGAATTNNGGTGGTTTFGTSLLTANGGGPGGPDGNVGGTGGTVTVSSPAVQVIAVTGGSGSAESLAGTSSGGSGAGTPFGGQGGGGAVAAGNAGVANTGAGGGGGSTGSANASGSGGGAGGYVKAIINSPSATYSYAVGSAGTGGAAGGQAGGAGGSGVIIVTEYYYNGMGAFAGNGGAYTPTTTVLTSGTGTFTTPANASYITVEMVGGGGGGAGSGTSNSGNAGTGGGTTTFGTSLLTATGGSGGVVEGVSNPSGGTATVTSPAIQLKAFTGGSGGGGTANSTSSTYPTGGNGASTPFGGAGAGGNGNSSSPAPSAIANTGSGGGGGAGIVGSSDASGGGAAGGYIFSQINSPSSTYSYSVGTGGGGGAAGTSGSAGGAGGSGVIIVTTYYNNGAVGTATNVTGIVQPANLNLSRTINAQTGTTYTFALSDGSGAGGNPLVTFGNSGATTVTVPANSSVAFPVGTQIDCIQQGAGTVTFSAAGGVTLNSNGGLVIGAQYVAVSLVQTAANTWTIIGYLT